MTERKLAGSGASKGRGGLVRLIAGLDDGQLTRWCFRGLLLGAIGVLALDLHDLSQANGWWSPQTETPAGVGEPILPPAVHLDGPERPSDPRRFLKLDEAVLQRPMSFVLEPGGLLRAEGSIDQGAAARFASEIEARGEYVKTISVNSPGGALDDAMAMARLVRERGLSMRVADGSICASSCPLFFAGGVERAAGEQAAVGVHQFYAVGDSPAAPAQAMADAQQTTARISRHLSDMGVDPALWLHALDTPPQALYYLSGEEMAAYRLVTGPTRQPSGRRKG